jgi:hypothetical protein
MRSGRIRTRRNGERDRGGRFLSSFVSICSALYLAGCDATEAVLDEDVDVQTASIVAGTPLSSADLTRFGLVAVYHPRLPAFTFAPRPCSGVIVSSVRFPPPFVGWSSVVMTARHCVCRNGVDGELASPDMLRLIPATAPGPAAPNPPAAAVPASQIIDLTGDHALIVVNVDWTAIASKRIGLYVGAPSALIGTSLTAFGYGLNVLTSCAPTDTAGAGVAQGGGLFTIDGGSTGNGTFGDYTYPNLAANGQQRVTCGDSGGPDVALFGAGPFSWDPGRDHVLGVHSGEGNGKETSIAVTRELQSALGGLYLSALNVGLVTGQGLNVAVTSGSLVLVDPRTDTRSAKFTYDADNRRVSVTIPRTPQIPVPTTGCLSVRLDAAQQPQPFVTACDTGDLGQRWSAGPNLQLGNDSKRMCLVARSTTSVGLATCSTSARSQRWFFHAQP